MADPSVPTLTISGFLGAGKTTLINTLLRNSEGRRIVVFVNDFGAINIDYDLIETVETDRIALSNGCVCCSLNDDLVRSMVGFCKTDPPDMFVIEASGVANPRALDASLQALHRSGLAHMQKRIYVMDADQFGDLEYADTEDLVDHAAASDLIVLNKADLVPQNALANIDGLLKQSAPRTARITTTFGEVPLKSLTAPHCRAGDHNNAVPAQHDTAALYETHAFAGFQSLSRARFNELTKAMSKMCLRAKGFVYLDDVPGKQTQVQLVGTRVNAREVELNPHLAAPPAQLVTIGWADQVDAGLLSRLLKSEPLTSKG